MREIVTSRRNKDAKRATTEQKKYGISKHAFGTAYSYCLQYPEWREELGSRTSTVKSPQITGMPGAHSGSDATANLAERRVELREKMQKVEDTVRRR